MVTVQICVDPAVAQAFLPVGADTGRNACATRMPFNRERLRLIVFRALATPAGQAPDGVAADEFGRSQARRNPRRGDSAATRRSRPTDTTTMVGPVGKSK